jgi:aryl-alcohol dehydrogenase-like predicted oxidoreductase
VIRFDDVDRIFSERGAMEAFSKAQKDGKIRYIGFTGHKDPHVHLYMLEKAKERGVRFDTVQMPLNPMDYHFRSFEKHVLPVLVEEGIGVLGMKSMGSGVLLKSKIVKPVECLHYALSLPTSVVITGIDGMEILEQALEAARTFEPLTDKQLDALRSKTADAAREGEYELFKTTSHFDSTAQNPEWLGEDPPRVKALSGS